MLFRSGAGVLVGVVSFFGRQDGTAHLNMVWERDQVRPASRLGFHDMLPEGQSRTWTGLMLDAGCPLRDAVSGAEPRARTAQAEPAAQPAPQTGGGTADRQAADALAQQVPDVASRQMSMECAVTGVTRAFAIRLADGRFKRFDEGGNTRAAEVFQGTAQGEAVLSGKAPGARPRVEVVGQELGDRIMVERIRIL